MNQRNGPAKMGWSSGSTSIGMLGFVGATK